MQTLIPDAMSRLETGETGKTKMKFEQTTMTQKNVEKF